MSTGTTLRGTTAPNPVRPVLAGRARCHEAVIPRSPRWENDTLFQAETLKQAQTHQTYTGRYLSVGLCDACAAQAAYGHQHGFAVIEEPCPRCVGIVAMLPKPEFCCWRSMNVKDALDAEHTGLTIRTLMGRQTCQAGIDGEGAQA